MYTTVAVQGTITPAYSTVDESNYILLRVAAQPSRQGLATLANSTRTLDLRLRPGSRDLSQIQSLAGSRSEGLRVWKTLLKPYLRPSQIQEYTQSLDQQALHVVQSGVQKGAI